MATGNGLPSVRDHADRLISDLIAQNQAPPNADAAALARGIPTFSKGTALIDPDTGQAIAEDGQAALPGFADGGVALPEGTPSAEPVGAAPVPPASTAPVKSAEELLAEHQQRLASPAGESAPESVAAAPLAQQAGAAAAEAAAQDIWADAEEFEFDEPDLSIRVPVRVPKQFAQTAKRDFQRRATYDRAVSYLKNAEPTLGPLIESGRLNPILPLLQAALDDPNGFGEYVVQGYQRKLRGEPLLDAARSEAAFAGTQVAPSTQTPPPVNPAYDPNLADPFLAEQLAPVQNELRTVTQRLEQYERQRAMESDQQRQRAEQDRRTAADMIAAHQDIARAYPEQASLNLGPQDPFWQKAVEQARIGGYVQAYGLRAGLVFGAQVAAQIEAERLSATSSPAATALANMDTRAAELARQQAAAASRTVGGGAPTQAPPPVRPQRPSSFLADGKTLKPAAQIVVENQAYIAATGGVPA